MGGGTGTGDVYVSYEGRTVSIFDLPNRSLYLINNSREEIEGPFHSTNVFGGLVKLSKSNGWDYINDEIIAFERKEAA